MDITRSPNGIKVLATPGFIRAAREHGGTQGLITEPLRLLSEALTRQPPEPSWIVVEPGFPNPQDEDEGRTRKLAGPIRYWAIRDDHHDECECGCSGQSVVTFLLPEEY